MIEEDSTILKIERSGLRDFLVALFVFLPSIANVPLFLHLFIIPFIGAKTIKLSQTLLLLVLIIILSTFNQIGHFDTFLTEARPVKELIPYSIFMLASYYFALHVNERVLRLILFFVIIEIFIGVLEYVVGVRSFIPGVRESVAGESPFGHKGLLYYSRVSGLSTNSSTFAMKIFAGVMIAHLIGFKKKWRMITIYSILGVGLLFTFTRSVYVAVAVFVFLANISLIRRMIVKLLMGKTKLFYILLVLLAITAFIAMMTKIELILAQLNRGMGSVDLSKRDFVFQTFYNFFTEHIWFGNGSYKLWILINDRLYHAHNVYLQVLSTNGILIGSLYFLVILININNRNYKYILPVLVLSLFQYAIFWGISFMDLIFFSFLLIKLNHKILPASKHAPAL